MTPAQIRSAVYCDAIRNSVATTYRGWTVSRGRWPEPAWQATSPNYDAWTDDEGDWTDNGEKADAPTREALIAEIDAWFEEDALLASEKAGETDHG